MRTVQITIACTKEEIEREREVGQYIYIVTNIYIEPCK